MTKEIFEWSTAAAANNFVPAEGGHPEKMKRSDVNDANRENMARIRNFYDDMEWLTLTTVGPTAGDIGAFARVTATRFTVTLTSTDFTNVFIPGRRLKIIDGGGAGIDLETNVAAAAYLADVTTVDITVTDTMIVTASAVQEYAFKSLTPVAFADVQTDFFIPVTADTVGIQDAIDACVSAGGGTVYLSANSYNMAAGGVTITTSANSGSVIIMGAGRTRLSPPTTGPTITTVLGGFDNEKISIRDMEIVALDTQVGVKVGATLFGAIEISNVQFTSGLTCLEVSGTSHADLHISDCDFHDYDGWAIKADSGPTFALSGAVIRGCDFEGSSITQADAAAIKVPGTWSITDNHITGLGDASISDRGIWLWNLSSSNDGGTRCTVTGNTIQGDKATAGRTVGIEVGGANNTITGNVIDISDTNGLGIHLKHVTGSTYIDNNTVTGNAVIAAEGIYVSRYNREYTVAGNTFRCTVKAADVQSEGGGLFSGNTFAASGSPSKGFDAGSSSRNVIISGNLFKDWVVESIDCEPASADTVVIGNIIHGAATRGITLAGSGAQARDNWIDPLVTTPLLIADSTSDTVRNHTVYQEDLNWLDLPTTTLTLNTVDYDDDTVTDILLPGGGGIGRYRMDYIVSGLSNTSLFYVYCGDGSGNKGDTLLYTSQAFTVSTVALSTDPVYGLTTANINQVTSAETWFDVADNRFDQFGIVWNGAVNGLNAKIHRFQIRKVSV